MDFLIWQAWQFQSSVAHKLLWRGVRSHAERTEKAAKLTLMNNHEMRGEAAAALAAIPR